VTPVLEKPYISVSINPENIRFLHFTNGGHTRKSIMAAPMFLRIKRSIATIEGSSEKRSHKTGSRYDICSQNLERKNLVRVYNPHQLVTRSCGGQMHK
jgi:hypothetical protein